MKYVDSEKLIAEIKKRMEERNDVRTVDYMYWPESDFWTRDNEDDEILYTIASLQQEKPGNICISRTKKQIPAAELQLLQTMNLL